MPSTDPTAALDPQAGSGSARGSAGAEGQRSFTVTGGNLVSLPVSSCPPLYQSLFPLRQLLLSSTATSSRKPRLSVLVESSLAHSCFPVAPGGLQNSGLTVLFKSA